MNFSVTPEPKAESVAFTDDAMTVHLCDGRSVSVPLEWFPSLRDASVAQLKAWRLIGGGIGIHWEELDEDLSTRALLFPT